MQIHVYVSWNEYKTISIITEPGEIGEWLDINNKK